MSPRTGPRRQLVAVRLSQSGIEAVDALALSEGLLRGNGEPNRSEMVRVLLGEALTRRQELRGRKP